MISTFIPSYNRAAQLHLLLESIMKYDNLGFYKDIYVYWDASNFQLRTGYEKLINNPRFNWVTFKEKGRGLGEDMLEVVNMDQYKFFGTITDDSVFFRKINLFQSVFDTLLMTDDVNHFTFRLGLNTNVIDYMQPNLTHKLNYQIVEDKFLKFNWVEHTNHYGFPCGIDNSIYHREHIKDLIYKTCGTDFTYRKFECKINDYLRMIKGGNKQYAICPEESCLVNIPCNQVVTDLVCQNGAKYPYTVEELNELYCMGYKIDLESITAEYVNSIQTEIPFKFIKDE